MKKIFGLFISTAILMVLLSEMATAQQKNTTSAHTFELGSKDFLLDGSPFQIISGEMHYSRIPKEYWRHRVQMAKAMGCNTIATYVFWNFHETSEGVFDFTTYNKNLGDFLKIVQEEGMFCLFRPGPYSCGEWDLGGIPPYLLGIPDIKFRCTDTRYLSAVKRYVDTISHIVKPYLVTNGGPVLMLQVENEYGSYGNDREYLKILESYWRNNGIDVPFYTSDGPTTFMLEAGTLPGAAVGLDSGSSPADFDLAEKMNPGVPVFSSETYPGWLTHWGTDWARPNTEHLLKEVKYVLESNHSLNFYMLHGGTNFAWSAGANSGGKGYEPDITSYDYDAPITEQGRGREKYYALKKLIKESRTQAVEDFPEPAAIPTMDIPEIKMEPYTSVWNNLPEALKMAQPKPFEAFEQYEGFALYRTTLIGRKEGKLQITDLHDFATVFLDGELIGTVDRTKGENTIAVPKSKNAFPVLEIFVEGMGRINFAQELIDRKGITERVSLNGMTLMNWEVYSLPMHSEYIKKLSANKANLKSGIFFKGEFVLSSVADTYIDMSNYKKGVVWVNGHNLGRYWEVGPQHALYCPAPFLKKGKNEIVVFDLLQEEAQSLKGVKELF
ncbi:beta-galactosidase [Marinilongibacter aquaticus]|uniref:glycoside hydrolase family 35 protein n=1 Tax=Marinilongibacter aquaticus TaxID=2975157 RepID=UPI0021BD3736|nr:beta-galactosidase family protein [Marinilongibacter aquaticus]UBM59236.1 beta-galactosidase [Marinilongibacter aquaticus]